MSRESGKWIIALASLAAVGVAALGFFVYSVTRPVPSSQQAKSSPAAAANQPQGTVIAPGRIEPKDGVVRVTAPASGSDRLLRLLVKPGEQVKAGQAVAIMDDGPRLQATALQAQAQAQEAAQKLTQIQASANPAGTKAVQTTVEQLEAQLHAAQQTYDRWSNLYKQGAISAVELESLKRKVDAIAHQLEQAQKKVNSTQDVSPADVQAAQSQVQSAIANFQKAKANLENAIVRAPISGQVVAIHASAKEKVGKDGILELGNTKQMDVVAEIHQSELNHVRVGQVATVTGNLLPKPLTGTVEAIGLAANSAKTTGSTTSNQNDQVIEVKIQLADDRPIAGLTHSPVTVAIKP